MNRVEFVIRVRGHEGLFICCRVFVSCFALLNSRVKNKRTCPGAVGIAWQLFASRNCCLYNDNISGASRPAVFHVLYVTIILYVRLYKPAGDGSSRGHDNLAHIVRVLC